MLRFGYNNYTKIFIKNIISECAHVGVQLQFEWNMFKSNIFYKKKKISELDKD